MRFKSFLTVGIVFFILISGCEKGVATSSSNGEVSNTESQSTAETSAKGPVIVAPENSYEFPSVVDGVKVTHDFIVFNKGDGDLEITRVKTG